jgi:hypothetical protein
MVAIAAAATGARRARTDCCFDRLIDVSSGRLLVRFERRPACFHATKRSAEETGKTSRRRDRAPIAQPICQDSALPPDLGRLQWDARCQHDSPIPAFPRRGKEQDESCQLKGTPSLPIPAFPDGEGARRVMSTKGHALPPPSGEGWGGGAECQQAVTMKAKSWLALERQRP